MKSTDFSKLGLHFQAPLWQAFYYDKVIQACVTSVFCFDETYYRLKQAWQALADEHEQTDWLINLFNHLYEHSAIPTVLVRGMSEPEYFASKDGMPARIEFAHGFFQSALHEISHWCVAGTKRRGLHDFGYWYCPDGRDEITQRQFEQVEIKPQAIECLLSLALGRHFYVSADNLNANFDTSNSTFATDVYAQAYAHLKNPHALPHRLSLDAKRLLWVFLDMNMPKLDKCHFADKSLTI